jgi:hypothetical protein
MKCTTLSLSPEKGLSSIDYIMDTQKRITAINWNWSDSTSTKTPPTATIRAATSLKVPITNTFVGFLSGSTTVLNKLSLLYFDQACIDKQAEIELNGVFFKNQTVPSTVKWLPDITAG